MSDYVLLCPLAILSPMLQHSMYLFPCPCPVSNVRVTSIALRPNLKNIISAISSQETIVDIKRISFSLLQYLLRYKILYYTPFPIYLFFKKTFYMYFQ